MPLAVPPAASRPITTLVGAIGGASAPTGFGGHSAPDRCTYLGLFHARDAYQLRNAGKPTVLMLWGCWNKDSVSPQYDAMGHRFLLPGDWGAAAVLVAAALADSMAEAAQGEIMMPLLARPGMPIGQAMLLARQDLQTTHPEATDVVLEWTLLGHRTSAIQRQARACRRRRAIGSSVAWAQACTPPTPVATASSRRRGRARGPCTLHEAPVVG